MTTRDIDALIEASSLGTPDAVAMRNRTSPEVARAVVARSKEIATEEGAALSLGEQPHDPTGCHMGGNPHLGPCDSDPATLTPEELVHAELTDDEDVR